MKLTIAVIVILSATRIGYAIECFECIGELDSPCHQALPHVLRPKTCDKGIKRCIVAGVTLFADNDEHSYYFRGCAKPNFCTKLISPESKLLGLYQRASCDYCTRNLCNNINSVVVNLGKQVFDEEYDEY